MFDAVEYRMPGFGEDGVPRTKLGDTVTPGLLNTLAVRAISSWLKLSPYPPRTTSLLFHCAGLKANPNSGPKFPFSGAHRFPSRCTVRPDISDCPAPRRTPYMSPCLA